MLRGDVSKLAINCNCSPTTIYSVAHRMGIDVSPHIKRCDKTLDCFSGETLSDENITWLREKSEQIISFRDAEKKQREVNRDAKRVARGKKTT